MRSGHKKEVWKIAKYMATESRAGFKDAKNRQLEMKIERQETMERNV